MSPDTSPDELTTVFAHLHGMLLPVQDATTAVSRLARAVHQMIPTAAGAEVSLFDEHGAPVSAAATDTLVEAADELQYELGAGPVPECVGDRRAPAHRGHHHRHPLGGVADGGG